MKTSRRSGPRSLSPAVPVALVIVALLVSLAPGCGVAGNAPVVRIDSGQVSGARAVGIDIYRGIPYAAPPVGDLRWRKPRPVKPWSGVRKCTVFGPECPQVVLTGKNSAAGKRPQSEDCLYLNVWTPARSSSSRLPVMFWIHGGAYQLGAGSAPLCDGQKLAEHGVVVVTINYRLGPLGFLALPQLTEESGHGSSGNYGLLDQQAAMRWVKKNISAFGGDPGRVTIFGESAGAMSVCTQMTSPLSKGLFHQVISESSLFIDRGLLMHATRPLAQAESIGQQYAANLGCASAPDVLAAMRAKPVDELISKPLLEGPGLFLADALFMPVIDGYVLPREPGDVFAQGKQSAVPLLIGSNSEEGNLFTFSKLITLERMPVPEYEQKIKQYFGAYADDVLAMFPVKQQSDIPGSLSKVFTTFDFTSVARWAAARQFAIGQKAYLYQFSKKPLPPMGFLGPCHGSELAFVFGTLVAGRGHAGEEESWTSLLLHDFERDLKETLVQNFARTDLDLSRQMMDYWTNFAKAGDPNGSGTTVEWPGYRPTGDENIELGKTVTVKTSLDRKACDLADRFYGYGD